MPLPSRDYRNPVLESPEAELEHMRRCRLQGLLPNPKALTGERKALAEELDRLSERMGEIDKEIFGNPEPIPF